MPEIKMTIRAIRTTNRDDVVVQRAIQLGLTPEEVFRRAYAEAGNSATTGETVFHQRYYPGEDGRRFEIPRVVKDFCASSASIICHNPACGSDKPKEGKKMFSRIAPNETAEYFCSIVCMNATPKPAKSAKDSAGRGKQEVRAEGKAVFNQICAAISQATLVTVPERQIRFMPDQPRKFFDEARLKSLADSMSLLRLSSNDPNVTGQLMPGFLRAVPKDKQGCCYELLDGERRLRAVRMAQIPVYRAMLIELDDDGARHVVSVIANFNREGHTVLELADTVCHMHEELGFTIQEVASTIGKHPIQVYELYRLRLLIPPVRDLLDPDKTPSKQMLTQGAAIEIAKMPGQQQMALAKKSIETGFRVADLKVFVREHGGSNSREISRTERRRNLEGSIRRLPTVVRILSNNMKHAKESDALQLFSDEEKGELRAHLSECSEIIKQALVEFN